MLSDKYNLNDSTISDNLSESNLLLGMNLTDKYDFLAKKYENVIKANNHLVTMYLISANGEYDSYERRFDVDAYRVISDRLTCLNPLDMKAEKSRASWSKAIAEKSEFLVNLVESIKGKCSPSEITVIHKICNLIYEDYIRGINKRNIDGEDVLIDTSWSPTLKDFYDKLIEDCSPEGTKLSWELEPYCIGNYSFFANKTNTKAIKTKFHNGNLFIIDIAEIPKCMKTFAILCCLEYIRNNTALSLIPDNDDVSLIHVPFEYEYFKTPAELSALHTLCRKLEKENNTITLTATEVCKRIDIPEGFALVRDNRLIKNFGMTDNDYKILANYHRVEHS